MRTRRLRAVGSFAISRRLITRITTCDSRDRHGQRGQPYQARYDSGHEFPHKRLLSEGISLYSCELAHSSARPLKVLMTGGA
ncbi:hypothetical protein BN2475_710089 [Paraburkholderia ribeironis]|uniref:Uncharacterized protein n=1 Tax=Paraburkholderia ribeironis TaxID=1247936 RepID=A0A1N7SIE7_9BURK|nr:hypothetical protein BN2475_710089 [Paraburkholderia ribeironis]